MTDSKKLTKWLNNTQAAIDMYYDGDYKVHEGTLCPQEVFNIKN